MASSKSMRGVLFIVLAGLVHLMFAKRNFAVTVLLAGSLLVSFDARGRQKNSPTIQDRQREQHSLAFNIVRAINTAEANYKKTHGSYATWNTLYTNGDFTDSGTKWSSESFPTVAHAMYGSGPEIVPGWKLRLNLSKDGSSYDLSLEDVTDAKCGYAVTSDERGMIRQGRSVACPS
jgi:hypothetical protein